jgi:hypothetical protein
MPNTTKALNSYKFQDSLVVTQQGTQDVVDWIQHRRETIKLENVENDKAYQRHDIDFIWITRKNVNLVEVKVDRYQTGNFFFETLSNQERNTPGCFLYTKANLILYYFYPSKILYTLPMPATKNWFLAHKKSFSVRATQTDIKKGTYTTVGCLVPIKRVLEEVPEVKHFSLIKKDANRSEPESYC